jgi:1,4-dihydroxy-2-naphthoyl-CoA hydrolase
MYFSYNRTVRFGDTDAAGVVYFAHVLSMCHEAYEESLRQSNFDLKTFFGKDTLAYPIVHAEVDFLAPMYCGDVLEIRVTSQLINEKVFELNYHLVKDSLQTAQAKTRHLCIETLTRKAKPLPSTILKWLTLRSCTYTEIATHKTSNNQFA